MELVIQSIRILDRVIVDFDRSSSNVNLMTKKNVYEHCVMIVPLSPFDENQVFWLIHAYRHRWILESDLDRRILCSPPKNGDHVHSD